MAGHESPKFSAGKNIAMKIPSHEFSRTVEFYRDVIGLPLVTEEAPNIVFKFGDKQLWIDKADYLSQAEIWLEICCNNLSRAQKYFKKRG